ncbi:MAG TPA: hypothetical protein VKL19_04340, partial [Thermoanaerobaculia bacterium]|nr:hypothetical protein [Thermoanaerobaculia bacterium]
MCGHKIPDADFGVRPCTTGGSYETTVADPRHDACSIDVCVAQAAGPTDEVSQVRDVLLKNVAGFERGDLTAIEG